MAVRVCGTGDWYLAVQFLYFAPFACKLRARPASERDRTQDLGGICVRGFEFLRINEQESRMKFQPNGVLMAVVAIFVVFSLGSESNAQSYCPSYQVYSNGSYYFPSSSCQPYSYYSYQPQYVPQSYSNGYRISSGIQMGVVQPSRIVTPAHSTTTSPNANRVVNQKPASTLQKQPTQPQNFYPNSAPFYQPNSFPSYSVPSGSWCYGGT